jgi:hypothetical protein
VPNDDQNAPLRDGEAMLLEIERGVREHGGCGSIDEIGDVRIEREFLGLALHDDQASITLLRGLSLRI